MILMMMMVMMMMMLMLMMALAADGMAKTASSVTVHNLSLSPTQQQIVMASLLLTAPKTPSFSKSALRRAACVLLLRQLLLPQLLLPATGNQIRQIAATPPYQNYQLAPMRPRKGNATRLQDA